MWSLVAILHTPSASFIWGSQCIQKLKPKDEVPTSSAQRSSLAQVCVYLSLKVSVRPFEVQSKAALMTEVWKSEKSRHAGTGSCMAGRHTWRHTRPTVHKQGIHITTSPGLLAYVLRHLTGKALESMLFADGCIWDDSCGEDRYTYTLRFPRSRTRVFGLLYPFPFPAKKFVLSLPQYTVRRYSSKLRK